MNRILDIFNTYFCNLRVNRYLIDDIEIKMVNRYERKMLKLYFKLLSFDINLFDLEERLRYLIDEINNVYDELKTWFCNYYGIDANNINIESNVDISTYYDLLYLKKDDYNSKLFDNIIKRYVNCNGYLYLKDNIIATKQLFLESNRLINEEVLRKFNEEINNMFIYYNNLLKSDLQDIKRLKGKKLIGPYQESYLKSFAGLWNYYYKRQRVLSRGKVI